MSGSQPPLGPRQPWHDSHCRIVGPAAWDVLQNFNERVLRQAADVAPDTLELVQMLEGKLSRNPFSRPNSSAPYNSQILRSVDGTTVKYMNPERLQLLFATPSEAIDRSIQDAYIYRIHNAKK